MKKKNLVSVCIALAVMGLGATVYATNQQDEKSKEAAYQYPPTKVALADVKLNSAPRTFFGVGELEAGQQVFVASETSGRIMQIDFQSGETVKKGQLLVQLNNAVEQADLTRYQAQLRNASRLHERTRTLYAKNLVAEAQVDSTQADRDMAQGSLRQTQALIAQKSIRAPFDGTIGIRQVHEGQYLNPGEMIASLVDTRILKLNFSLDEQATPELHAGQIVDITVDAYPNQRFPAKISAIDPLIGKSRTVQVQATLDNTQGQLKAGMYANVNVVRQANNQVLTIPETAITYTAYGDTVFIAQGEGAAMKAQRVSVKIGQRWDGIAEIEQGLTAGQKVITSGQLKLSDGTAIVPVAQDTLTAKTTAGTP